MKLLVTGGNGFIGREVCRLAAHRDHDVFSLSRSGRPAGLDADWADEVTWLEGDVLRPESWRDHLKDVDAVIHCVGIIKEKPEEGITFERLNGDAADIASWEAEHAGVERFVFLSAKSNPPFLSSRYLAGKRQGEAAIRGRDLASSMLRPNFVYGPGRAASYAFSAPQKLLLKIPGLRAQVYPDRPLHVDQVALAAIRAATEEGFGGVIGIDNIEYLAGDEWQVYAEASDAPSWNPRPAVVGAGVVGLVGGALWGALRRS